VFGRTVSQVVYGLKEIQLGPGIEGPTGAVSAFVEHEIAEHLVKGFGIPPAELEALDDMWKARLQNADHGLRSSIAPVALGDRRRWPRSKTRVCSDHGPPMLDPTLDPMLDPMLGSSSGAVKHASSQMTYRS
jgi:hypothetical protein